PSAPAGGPDAVSEGPGERSALSPVLLRARELPVDADRTGRTPVPPECTLRNWQPPDLCGRFGDKARPDCSALRDTPDEKGVRSAGTRRHGRCHWFVHTPFPGCNWLPDPADELPERAPDPWPLPPIAS